MSQFPSFGLAIDWETSGYSVPTYTAHHQGISFGAIIFDIRTLQPIEQIYHEIKFNEKYQWSYGAEKIHGLSREYLNENGISQEEAASDLGNLVVKYLGTEEIILLGHRVYFDKAFTSQLMMTLGFDFNYHPTQIDSSAMGTILLETTKSDDLFQILDLPKRGKHNSLEDIQYTLESVRKMKEIFINGVSSIL